MRERRVQNAFDEVASTIHQALPRLQHDAAVIAVLLHVRGHAALSEGVRVLGPDRECLSRHHPHCRPSCHESNGIR